jgi:hypothetical protein
MRQIIHFSNHKCLTVYYGNVSSIFSKALNLRFMHFNSNKNDFLHNHKNYHFSLLNNHSIDINILPDDCKITRFIRDPRDLIVSGYFYHKRGAENWCNIRNPSQKDWERVNGKIPSDLGPNVSFSEHLQRIDLESGLRAEMEFREFHFESLKQWTNSPRVKVFRYEEIILDELSFFEKMAEHYEFNLAEQSLWCGLAYKLSAAKQSSREHIRNPESSQYKKVFTNDFEILFNETHGDLIKKLEYDL